MNKGKGGMSVLSVKNKKTAKEIKNDTAPQLCLMFCNEAFYKTHHMQYVNLYRLLLRLPLRLPLFIKCKMIVNGDCNVNGLIKRKGKEKFYSHEIWCSSNTSYLKLLTWKDIFHCIDFFDTTIHYTIPWGKILIPTFVYSKHFFNRIFWFILCYKNSNYLVINIGFYDPEK